MTTRSVHSRKSLLLLPFVFLLIAANAAPAIAAERNYRRLVILADLHLPGETMSAEERVISDINNWRDVDMVAVLGDICADVGSREEYEQAGRFFSRLKKPAYFIAGNHDYIYEDRKDEAGKKVRGAPATRKAKLSMFREVFGMQNLYYSRREGDYRLLFLSADHLTSPYPAHMSDDQLAWLRAELRADRSIPTIIFFHAPLAGTMSKKEKKGDAGYNAAQPQKEIGKIISENPQIFLWVSGHTHIPPKNEDFKSPLNLYEKQVMNIHNANLNRKTIWTNSLYLYPDRVVVKTYNHRKGIWFTAMERVITPVRKQVSLR